MEPQENDPDLIAYIAAVEQFNNARGLALAARKSQEAASEKMWALAGVLIEKGYRITLPV